MNREFLLNRVAPAAALCCLLAFAATPALAQVAGGIDPVSAGRNLVTLVMSVLSVVFVLAWVGAAAACISGRIPGGYLLAAGAGTILFVSATVIYSRISGGGGGGGFTL